MHTCRHARTRYAVHCEVDRKKLAWLLPFPKVAAGFECIEQSLTEDSFRTLTQHEQVNMLKQIVYDDLFIRMLLDWN